MEPPQQRPTTAPSQSRRQPTPSQSDRPPAPGPVDLLIDRNQGSTVALEATRRRMEASKRVPPPSPYQRIEQLARENAGLREEMVRLQRLDSANAYFKKETKEAVERLQQAIFEWRRAHKDIAEEFAKEKSGYSESVNIGISRSG